VGGKGGRGREQSTKIKKNCEKPLGVRQQVWVEVKTKGGREQNLCNFLKKGKTRTKEGKGGGTTNIKRGGPNDLPKNNEQNQETLGGALYAVNTTAWKAGEQPGWGGGRVDWFAKTIRKKKQKDRKRGKGIGVEKPERSKKLLSSDRDCGGYYSTLKKNIEEKWGGFFGGGRRVVVGRQKKREKKSGLGGVGGNKREKSGGN